MQCPLNIGVMSFFRPRVSSSAGPLPTMLKSSSKCQQMRILLNSRPLQAAVATPLTRTPWSGPSSLFLFVLILFPCPVNLFCGVLGFIPAFCGVAGRQGVSDASSLWAALRGKWGYWGQGPHSCALRDSILHCVRHSGMPSHPTWQTYQSHPLMCIMIFSSDRCAIWRLLRRVATRPFPGCDTSHRMEIISWGLDGTISSGN